MAKRRADKQLNDQNWDEEEAPEKPEVFVRASDEVLAKRVIHKARRMNAKHNADDGARPSPFSGFSFYGANGGSSTSTNLSSTSTATTTPALTISTATTQSTVVGVNLATGSKTSDEYLSKVAQLNRSIVDCITRLISREAYLNLGPCFETYKEHFQRLTGEEEDRQSKNNNSLATSAMPTSNSVSVDSSPKPFSLSSATSNGLTSEKKSPTNWFGGKTSTETSSEGEKTFPAFGSNSLKNSEKVGGVPSSVGNGFGSSTFSFGSASSKTSTFTFGLTASGGIPPVNQLATNTTTTTSAEDADDEPPPKVDIAPVQEDGSLYMKKVKLFYKKKQPDEKGQFAEKGVGFLHVKKIEGGGNHHQLLVRAQTTLGNVLLNIRIGKDLPVNRVGNNNVAIMCVPNPPLDPKSTEADKVPTMFLIRVKTTEDADELAEKLNEFKKATE